ncbi:hypothetical protein [Streptomyces sp. NPDC102360]|uniref:hypothetical protein n=1 Tax=Streptomyces sp. NPDC102360 TaxID=3366160 RepID=UPI0038289097
MEGAEAAEGAEAEAATDSKSAPDSKSGTAATGTGAAVVDRPEATNWHAGPADAVPFS